MLGQKRDITTAMSDAERGGWRGRENERVRESKRSREQRVERSRLDVVEARERRRKSRTKFVGYRGEGRRWLEVESAEGGRTGLSVGSGSGSGSG